MFHVNFSDQPVDKNQHSIFLAGPTRRQSEYAVSWRKQAVDILHKYQFNGTVYVPEFSKNDIPVDLTAQAGWEREALYHAKIIVFYINRHLPDMSGFTTNVEFGMWLARKPESVILCIPENAEKTNYLRWLYETEKPGSPIYANLDEVLQKAVLLSSAEMRLTH